jgi:effector-binding domain-containing protein
MTSATAIEERVLEGGPTISVAADLRREDVASWWWDALASLRAIAAAAGLEQTGPVGGLFDDELFTQDAGHARVYLPVRDSPALDGTGARWELPAGRFAVALHAGPHRDVDRAYAALGTYAAAHGRDGAGPVRERYVADPLDTRTPPSGGPRPAGRWPRQASRLTRTRAGQRIVVPTDQRALGGAAMDDILSQGEDREPSPWPRRLAVIGALVLAAVAGVIYLSHPRHPHSPAATLPTPVTTSPAPAPVGLAVPGLPDEPDGIGGHTLPWADNLRLPVTGTQPAWFSPATDRSEPIGGLPGDSSGYQFTRIGGGWAVQANSAARVQAGDDRDPACSDCAGPPLPVWFLADGARSVTRVGTANQVAPAATASALWLTSYPLNAAISTTAGTAREVSHAGVPLGAPVRLPPGYVISQATDRGLLLAPVSPQPGTTAYKLWDAAAPGASRTFDGVIAATATEIAWVPNCAPQCRIQMLNLATGRQATVRLPAASSAASGAFSPSGDFLALQVSSGNTGDDGALAMQLEVASVTSGHLTAVPGTFASSDALVGFGWPANSDSLVAEFIFMTKTQLASWHPGATRPAVAVIRPGRDQAALIVG